MASPVSTTERTTVIGSLRGIGIAFAVTVTVIAIVFRGDMDRIGAFWSGIAGAYGSPHWPDLSPLLGAGPVIQAHVVTVLIAFGIGTLLLLGVKGNLLHRTLGWAWVIFMLATAAISFFIREIGNGQLGFIHIFSALVLIQAPLAVYFARTHKVRSHKNVMSGLYFGALMVAGIFTFLPGRIMYHVFFS